MVLQDEVRDHVDEELPSQISILHLIVKLIERQCCVHKRIDGLKYGMVDVFHLLRHRHLSKRFTAVILILAYLPA